MNIDDLYRVVRERRTVKVLGTVDEPTVVPTEVAMIRDAQVREAVLAAGMAPFHYPRSKEIAEPWRAYHLWNEQTNALATYLSEELGDKTKIPQLCAACSALVLITWLPEFPGAEEEKQRVIEEEHIAATSAMTQNLLLLLTGHGMGNYWSSGGVLRTPAFFDHLGISTGERLMGAIFIEYPEMSDDGHVRKAGALREKRSTEWVRDLG